MTDWRSLRGSNFLKPEDLGSGPALITIVAVESEKLIGDDDKAKKEVKLDITARHRNPDTGQPEDLPQTEWVANVVNLTLLEAMFGTPHVEQWVGRKALLQQEPCEVRGKYFGQPSVRVCGGPELTQDLHVDVVLRAKGGKKRKPIHKILHQTQRQHARGVDQDTGEIIEADVTEDDAIAAQADYGVPTASEGADSGELFGGEE